MKGQTNHAQADQRLYFSKTASECSLLEQRSKSFPFTEINIFSWWAKIVAVGSDHRIVYCPEKIMDRRLAQKPA